MHIILGGSGHVGSAAAMLVEAPGHLRRRKRPELGIALIDLDA